MFVFTYNFPFLQTSFNDTALLLFSRTTTAEAAAKNFFLPKEVKRNKALTVELIKRATSVALKSRLPFFSIDERQQQGHSFGEKLANAIEQVYSKGFQKVIVIGNDCLQLESKTIRAAAETLASNQQVLMPTSKGGVSLVGINKNSFDSTAFAAIPWQTEYVFEALKVTNLSTFILPTADDVNNFFELQQSVRQLSRLCSLYSLIVSFVSSLQTFFVVTRSEHTNYNCLFYGLTAPPVKH